MTTGKTKVDLEKKAKAHFREGLNCAQAVWKAFRPDDTSEIEMLRAHGGGRAEGGLCGALHAARKLVTDETERHRVNDAFHTEAGAVRCRDVRARKQLSCRECVALAARIGASLGNTEMVE